MTTENLEEETEAFVDSFKMTHEDFNETKHLLIKDQWVDLDIRFVFVNAGNKISRTSKTTYADWCDRHKFLWAEGLVPMEWLHE